MEQQEKLLWISRVAENSSVVFYSLRLVKGWPLEFISENISQYGYAAEELISGNVSIGTIIHPDDLERSFDEMERFFAGNGHSDTYFRHEFRLLTKDQQARWVENSVKIVRDASGAPLHYQGTMIDITQRKRMEEELILANIVVENSSVILYRFRLLEGWPTEYISKNISHYGYAAEDFMSGALAFSSIIHPEDAKRVYKGQYAFVKQIINRFLRQEYRIITKDGKVRWVEDVSEVVRDLSAFSTHFQGTIVDITERKESEQIISSRNAELKKLNDFMVDRELKMIELKAKIKQLEEKLRNK